ncbi:porin [Rhodovulum euryhalinum]|uniref:Outer membrane protein OmpU n=1 Tax=Rhodovulum euryhalinum TaxID=35805 RepID=A0A4V2SA18_9RHOB|nr:porin [Rhodovulum euryhalinum]TCO69600.1 outer membrane protein OmpU [Rhodovulum euryhalinum]
MKKVLFATTALVATAGIAAAEITFSGYAEMGVVGGGDDSIGFAQEGANNATTQFHNDLMLKFSASTETDMGVTVGVSTEIQKAEGEANGNFGADNTAMFISGSFGTLTMGEIDGAADYRLTENSGNPGTIGDDETIHAGFNFGYGDAAYDNQILRYDYNFGDFGFSVSTELDDSGARDDGFAVGVNYNTQMTGVDLGLGLAYQEAELNGVWAPGYLDDYGYAAAAGDMDLWGLSLTADFQNGFVGGLTYTSYDFTGNDDADHWSISMGYEINAWSFHANYGEYDWDVSNDASGYGLVVAYDLGGGASVHAGYGDSDIDNTAGDFETWSLGLAMKF